MTKRTNWQSSIRVDIPDLENATHTFSESNLKLHILGLLQDNFACVPEGFRVQIANQGTSPGQFTVYNGLSLDRSGQLIVNEDASNTARSATLVANTTYYVEVQFVLTPSDTDSRGFWDPTFDNGSDPSGDQRPFGKEFLQNVATRLSSDWQLIT